MFRLLVDQIGAARLGEVRRFTQFWERSASLRLRAGDASVLDLYQSHGRIVGGTRTDMVEVAFDAWRKSRAEGHSVGVLAPDHAGVDALALRARAHRVAAGEVEAVGVTAGNQTIGVGDEVVTCRNDRRLRTDKGTWVRNGQRWVVTARYPTPPRGRCLRTGCAPSQTASGSWSRSWPRSQHDATSWRRCSAPPTSV